MSNIFACLYGREKSGKTTAVLTLAGPDTLFVGRPRSLNFHWGHTPNNVIETPPITQLRGLLNQWSNEYAHIVLDDVSLLASFVRRNVIKATGFKIYAELADKHFLPIFDTCKNIQANVILTCHERPAEPEKGRLGGPRFPGKLVGNALQAETDFIAQMIYDEEAPGWPFRMSIEPNELWVRGDRLGVFGGRPYGPPNMAEIFRAAGQTVGRPPGLEWMEAAVEQGAEIIIPHLKKNKEAGLQRGVQAASRSLKDQLGQAPNQGVMAWVLTEAMHRAQLRAAEQSRVRNFIESLSITI